MTTHDDLAPLHDDDPDGPPPPGYDAPQMELLVRRVRDLVDAARPMPLSASSMVNKEELLELLDQSLERMPEELKNAKWLLKEREEFLARVRREGDDIIRTARAEAERMVQRTEVVKAADDRARLTVEAAEARARQLRLETEDYCDQKLASFEVALEKTLRSVQDGRARLQAPSLSPLPSDDLGHLSDDDFEVDLTAEEPTFFDQDSR